MEADRLGLCKTLKNNSIILIIDTNFAIYMSQGLISPSMILDALERRFSPVVCPQTLRELLFLSQNAKQLSTRRHARMALSTLDRIGACIISCPGEDADDSIVMAAAGLSRAGYKVVVATSDRTLRRRLRSRGVPTLYYRESERTLETDWDIL